MSSSSIAGWFIQLQCYLLTPAALLLLCTALINLSLKTCRHTA
jgi:hypothetical protein